MVVDGAVVLPSVNVSRLQAAHASGGGEGFEMVASSARLCKSLQAIRSNGGMAPLVGYSEHVAYGPPPVHHRLQGPSSILHTYVCIGLSRQGPSNTGDQKEEAKVDLRSRGLCLVPLSCTSYVTNENGVWAPPEYLSTSSVEVDSHNSDSEQEMMSFYIM